MQYVSVRDFLLTSMTGSIVPQIFSLGIQRVPRGHTSHGTGARIYTDSGLAAIGPRVSTRGFRPYAREAL